MDRKQQLVKLMSRYCDCEDCEPVRISSYYDDGSSGYECAICDKEVYFEYDEDGVCFIRMSVDMWKWLI
jgi:hypothetical protein